MKVYRALHAKASVGIHHRCGRGSIRARVHGGVTVDSKNTFINQKPIQIPFVIISYDIIMISLKNSVCYKTLACSGILKK